MIDKLKYHEKNPEQHPNYPDEWKKFWNRRYKELQAEGKNPAKHDFKPEWIQFWNRRMREMYDDELKSKKDEWRVRLGLPNEETEEQQQQQQQQQAITTAARSAKRARNMGGARSSSPAGNISDDVIVLSPASSSKDEKASRKDVTVADIKNTWKALTGSDIKESGLLASGQRSPSPWEESESSKRSHGGGDNSPSHGNSKWWQGSRVASGRGRGRGMRNSGPHRGQVYEPNDGPGGVVHALRLLTALENQLGSLGPQVNTLLAKALALEKVSSNSSEQLLTDPTHYALFDTAREKLKGQLFAGIVERNMVMATRSAVESVNCLLIKADKLAPGAAKLAAAAVSNPVIGVPSAVLAAAPPLASPVTPSTLLSLSSTTVAPPSEPVVVPGIGAVDKVAIAQQIAEALVAQGRTDVSQEELESLINAVVGMAQASAGSQAPISAAMYARQQQEREIQQQHANLQQGQIHGALTVDTSGSDSGRGASQPRGSDSPFTQLLSSVARSATGSSSGTGPSALQILQSAYGDSSKFAGGNRSHRSGPFSGRADCMDDLSEEDLKTLLQNFKELPSEEQYGLISYLKKVEAKEPARVERLRQFVNVGQLLKSPKKEMQPLRKTPLVKPYSTREKMSESKVFQNPKSSQSEGKSDRLSPFSLREGGINPSGEGRVLGKLDNERNMKVKMEDSDDEDYTFEDIYAAASRKVKEREKAIAEETAKLVKEEEKKKKKAADDPRLLLKETKAIIANLMGQLPAKFIQKQSPAKESTSVSNKTESNIPSGTSVKQPMFDLSALQQPQQPMVQEPGHPDNTTMNQHGGNMDVNSQYYSNYPDQSGNYAGQYQNQWGVNNEWTANPMQSMQTAYPAQGGYGGSGYTDGGYYSSQQQPQMQPQPQSQPSMCPQQEVPQMHHHHIAPQQQQYASHVPYGDSSGVVGFNDPNMVNSGYQHQQQYQPPPQNYSSGYGQSSGQHGYY